MTLLAAEAEVEAAAERLREARGTQLAEQKAAKEAAEQAACTAAREQLAGVAGVIVEGIPQAEYNAIYLSVEEHEGWLRFESPEGQHMYRQIEQREWQLADRFYPDAEYSQDAEIKTPDGVLPVGSNG